MELLTRPEHCLENIEAVQQACGAGDVSRALAVYWDRYRELSRKAALEWELAAVLRRVGVAVPAPSVWPPDLLERPSGACLAFVVSQLAGAELRLPPGLCPLPPVRRSFKEALAWAWLLRPDCVCLEDRQFRFGFAAWLSASPEAIGLCLLASAQRGDTALVERLGSEWLRQGLFHAEAPDQIHRASNIPGLEELAREAVRIATGGAFADRNALLRLLEAAFRLGESGSVLALGETLLACPDLEEEDRRRALALHLAALADLDRLEDVEEQYRARWQTTSWAYPHPELLLYVFQQRGTTDLERHLLESAEMNDATPAWVWLSRDLIRNGEARRSDLEAWEDLYQKEAWDERVLVGASNAALRCPALLRNEWVGRLDLRERWRGLAGLEGYRDLAGAFLVLFQNTDEDLIEEFEARLAGSRLSTEPVRRAARAYVGALRRLRRWSRLLELSDTAPDLFALACPFKEREIARVMAVVAVPPRGPMALRSWCAGWERLLSLPLETSEVIEVLDHFLHLRRELERCFPEALEEELLEDVALQVLRRVKAEAEAVLRGRAGDREAVAHLRRRVRQGGAEMMLRILQELGSQAEGDPHD